LCFAIEIGPNDYDGVGGGDWEEGHEVVMMKDGGALVARIGGIGLPDMMLCFRLFHSDDISLLTQPARTYDLSSLMTVSLLVVQASCPPSSLVMNMGLETTPPWATQKGQAFLTPSHYHYQVSRKRV